MPTIRDIELFLNEQRAHCGIGYSPNSEINALAKYPPPLAVDIETPIKWKRKVIGHTKKGTPKIKKEKGARFIACVGFADSAEHSLTIPTTKSYWGNDKEHARAWELIAELLALPNEKIFQNGWFDCFHFNRLGMPVRNWKWDTMCVPGDTEVLTPRGWVCFDRLVEGTPVAQWSPSGEITWCPAHMIVQKGAEVLIHSQARYHQGAYTANHRIPILWQRNKSLCVKRADEVEKLRAVYIPVGGKLNGVISYPWIRMLVAIQADGHITKQQTVIFDLKKRRKIKRLKVLIKELGVETRDYKSSRSDVTRFCLAGNLVKVICGRLAGKDKLFGSWLLTLTQEDLAAFVDEVQFWDGYVDRKSFVYATKHRENAEWVATAAHLVGKSAHIHETVQGCWTTTVKRKWYVSSRQEHYSRRRHDGPVFCLRTETGYFLARRNKTIFVTGNSLHHVLIPNEDHSLAYMGSVDTRQPYWKDDSKSVDRGIPVDLETYWKYNGIDCTVTWELHAKYIKDLEACGRLDLYLKHHRRLFKPLLQMSVEGIRSDEHRRKQRFAQLTADLIRKRNALTALAGEELYGKKGSLSTKKLRTFLYDKLGLPPMMKGVKGEQKITTDEIAVRKYQLKFGRKRPDVDEACQLILDHRRSDKLRSFYAAKTCDEDGRIRCSYSIAPESGRLSSSKNPMGSGMNLQNVDREARDHFVPDEGHILVRIDMAQVESRYVYMFTGDEELIERARAMPWAFDDHAATAAVVFGVSESEVTKAQRYFGKRVNHASNYDMQGKRMSDEMLKDGVVETPERCQAMIEARMDAAPAIRSVFHRETRRTIMTERALTNSWGHRLDLTDVRLGPDVFREGYAFRASSEASFTINRWGLIPAFKYCKGRDAKIRNQVHDELVFSCAPDEAWDLVQFVRQSMERPRPTPYGEITIPVTVKVAMNWSSGHEWAKPPKKSAFVEVVRQLMEEHATHT